MQKDKEKQLLQESLQQLENVSSNINTLSDLFDHNSRNIKEVKMRLLYLRNRG